MADEDKTEKEDGDKSSGDADGEKKKKGSKKLLMFGVIPLLLILGGGGGAMFMSMMGGKEDPAAEKKKKEAARKAAIVYFPLPEILVNLNSNTGKTHYLKIKVSLELPNAGEVKKVEEMMPRIIDNFQVYLRELRVEDLRGSAGLYRLREELLARVNAAAAPAKVSDILFKEMLVQ